MGSGSSAQAYQLTAEEAADVDTFLAAGLAQVPSMRRRVEEMQARAHDSDTLPEEVCSLHQAETAAAQRIQELDSYLREEAKGVEQVLGSAGGGMSSSAELATEARREWNEVIVRIKALWESQKLKHILEIQEQRFGKEDRDTLNTKIDLAAALQLQKDFTGAQKQLEEVFEVLSRARSADLKPQLEEVSEALGRAGSTDLKDDPITRRAVDCFASLLGCLHEDKETVLKEVSKMQSQKLGEEHPLTVNSKADLAVLQERDEQKEAAQVLKEILREPHGHDVGIDFVKDLTLSPGPAAAAKDPKERVSHSLPAPPGPSDAGTTLHDLATDGDDKKAGSLDSEKLQEVAQLNEEVRSLRQAEAAAARRIEELERLREAEANESQRLREEVAQLQEEVRSFPQADAAAAQNVQEPENRLPQVDVQEPHLYFTLRDKPAILEKTADIPYHGHIKREEGLDCYVSFPGKYAAGWDALIKERHGQSVACVFLCTPADGLGKHYKEEFGGQCYCPTIYGQRDFRTFGYLKELPASCSEAEEKIEVEKAKATKTVVVRSDASDKDKQEAEEKARQAWENSGRVASWGCEWFHTWKKQVAEAVRLKQRLKVVFFPAQTGKGIVSFEDLNRVNLWDGVGCGGSQKCEIAYLERMRQQQGEAWNYDHVDVSHFLKEEFKVGAKVDAWDGKQWCRGTLLDVPLRIPEKPEEAKWTVESQTKWHIFVTDRVRHADLIQAMLAEVGRENFVDLVKDSLSTDLGIVTNQDFVFPDGTPSLALRLGIDNIASLQHVRNVVLNSDLESRINESLKKWQAHVDKTHFCKVFERELLNLSDLTDHQKEKVRDIKDLMKHGDVHLSAP